MAKDRYATDDAYRERTKQAALERYRRIKREKEQEAQRDGSKDAYPGITAALAAIRERRKA